MAFLTILGQGREAGHGRVIPGTKALQVKWI